jgi:hypothetical protein
MEVLGLVGGSVGVSGGSVAGQKYFLKYRLIAIGDGGALLSPPELTGPLDNKLRYLPGFFPQRRRGVGFGKRGGLRAWLAR